MCLCLGACDTVVNVCVSHQITEIDKMAGLTDRFKPPKVAAAGEDGTKTRGDFDLVTIDTSSPRPSSEPGTSDPGTSDPETEGVAVGKEKEINNGVGRESEMDMLQGDNGDIVIGAVGDS